MVHSRRARGRDTLVVRTWLRCTLQVLIWSIADHVTSLTMTGSKDNATKGVKLQHRTKLEARSPALLYFHEIYMGSEEIFYKPSSRGVTPVLISTWLEPWHLASSPESIPMKKCMSSL